MAKPRIGPKFNVSLPDDVLAAVDELRGTKPRSAMSRELIIEALELRAAVAASSDDVVVDNFTQADGGMFADKATWLPLGEGIPVVAGQITHDQITLETPDGGTIVGAQPGRPDADLYRIIDIDGEKIRIGFRCDKDQHARCRAPECECSCHGDDRVR